MGSTELLGEASLAAAAAGGTGALASVDVIARFFWTTQKRLQREAFRILKNRPGTAF